MERMFSFFRRSKKDKERNGSNNEKQTKDRAKEQDDTSAVVVSTEVMCKNNLPTQKAEIALNNINAITLPTIPPDFDLRENISPSSEVTVLHGDDDSKISNEITTMSENDSAIAQPISYAGVLRKTETTPPTPNVSAPRRSSSGVKPCGHGTVAISPRIPFMGMKREKSITPPTSPKIEVKNVYKRSASDSNYFALANGANEKNDVVSGSMKLHVNIPTGSVESSPNQKIPPIAEKGVKDVKKNLINQEAKFQSQLNELSKQLSVRDAEANKLRFQMDELQRDVFAKSAGMDRLQAELHAAQKESDIIKLRIRHLENDLQEYREKNNQLSEELAEKAEGHAEYESEAKAKIAELESVVKELEQKIELLENEVETIKREKDNLEQQRLTLLAEKEEGSKKLNDIIEQAMQQKREIEKKWKDDFEKLRTINIMKEQQMLDDFEWKLREVQKNCKQRLVDKDKIIQEKIQESYKEVEAKMKEAEELMRQVDQLKSVEIEVEQLRNLTYEQEKSIRLLLDQQEQMKVAETSLKTETKRLRNMIEMEKENLQHIQRLHHQELLDKERKLNQTLNQKRTEIAMYWEERLLNEICRLKYELEQLNNEEKYYAMEMVRREKNEELEKCKRDWEQKMKEKLKEIEALKRTLTEREEYHREEVIRTQTNTDRDILELRRLMDKIDMSHHDKFEKLVQKHEEEIERINKETEERIQEVEESYQSQVTSLRTTLELVKEQMERESQQKVESLIEQHRSELDSQWQNLIDQKSEAVKLVEDEFISKYRILEEQFYTQQRSHGQREIELLKTIDSLKNELDSKGSTIDDLQNNVDTLEGGVQVLNEEIAHQGEQLIKTRRESEQKIRSLQEAYAKLQTKQEDEREAFRLKLMSVQKQSQETIDHLQRKCTCLTKLFEEVRLRYERRESRQEDLNIISDLKQVIAEQEKDLACLNEEKRYFQMRLISLEKQLDGQASGEEDEERFEDAKYEETDSRQQNYSGDNTVAYPPSNGFQQTYSTYPPNQGMFTIPECDE